MRTTATRPFPHDDRLRKPSRAASHVVRITAILLALGLLGACSIRLETPAQVEPSPGAVEQVRARTLDDATDLAQAAQSALATKPSKAVAAVLTDVAEFSDQHAAQLGPVYDSGLTPSPTATTAPPASDAAAVLADLADATRTALADADDVDDAGLARLVASIATARDQLTRRLARATGVDTPDLDVVVQPTPAPSPTGSPAPEPTPSPEQTQAAQSSSADDLDALVLAHDQAGYAYEVIAAQQSGDVRTQARDAAAAHRDEAQRWAVAAGTAQTKDDPRRAAYTLPDGLTTTRTARRLAVSLESGIAEADATLVARTPAGERQPFMDGLRTATAAARSWGGAAVAFPGLPERAQS
ncbi:DUF4439 domain-containing protein [Cellulomonas rhizosphaerae]|uniref:DUF4439 domain-containing protein n=1 Tax=Cellulomonas rhizosphaerae TaxID=2293719 RepID=A0A413RNF6_9CELL|nr:DUF4439 domain-containing protein [Cellulomonas rhizosphaerae]RHA43130.1 DUF4439 domain-containing protein [Cellulomonas rhizosphaerae]